MCKFDNGIDAFGRVQSSVCRASQRAYRECADSLATGFDDSARHGRFQHQGGSGVLGFFFHQRARSLAANFFVTGEQDGQRPFCGKFLLADRSDSLEQYGNSRFHVEDAGAVRVAFGSDAEGKPGQGAQRPDRIQMANDQQVRFTCVVSKVEPGTQMRSITRFGNRFNPATEVS